MVSQVVDHGDGKMTQYQSKRTRKDLQGGLNPRGWDVSLAKPNRRWVAKDGAVTSMDGRGAKQRRQEGERCQRLTDRTTRGASASKHVGRPLCILPCLLVAARAADLFLQQLTHPLREGKRGIRVRQEPLTRSLQRGRRLRGRGKGTHCMHEQVRVSSMVRVVSESACKITVRSSTSTGVLVYSTSWRSRRAHRLM